MSTGFYGHPLHEALTRTVAPSAEPVTLAEAKLYLRQDADDEDDLISALIVAAREYAEVAQKRQLMPATYELRLDQFPLVRPGSWSQIGPAIVVPMPKLVAVSSVAYVAANGDVTTLDAGRYVVDSKSQPGRITPVHWQPWPTVRPQPGAVVVTYTAGYADAAAVPEGTKLAMKLLIGHWYRNREAVGNVGGPLELAVATLLAADAVGSYY